MNAFQTILLGLVQGLTEFLPISSSAHLYLIQEYLNWGAGGNTFEAAIHLGTVLASAIVFREEIMGIINRFIKSKNKLDSDLSKVIVVSIPVLIIGFMVKDLTESVENPIAIAAMLIIVGVAFLFFSGKELSKEGGLRKASNENNMLPTWMKTLVVSLSQILAFIPGTSRSGITILTGRITGINFNTALYTSFILSIPVVSAAGAWGLISEISKANTTDILPFILGLAASTISGYFAGVFLKSKLPKIGLIPFGVYRIFLGSLILITYLLL